MEGLTLSPQDIFLDIGANLGWYALLFAKKFGVKVYAFEPDPLNIQLLKHNIVRNVANTVEIIPKAVSDTNQTMRLYQYKQANLGRHSLLPFDTPQSTQISAITLNRFISAYSIDIDRIQLIKMDIEGHEHAALKGASDLLGRVPIIVSEYSPAHLRAHNICLQDYLMPLQLTGYSPFQLSAAGTLNPLSLSALYHPTQAVSNIIWKQHDSKLL